MADAIQKDNEYSDEKTLSDKGVETTPIAIVGDAFYELNLQLANISKILRRDMPSSSHIARIVAPAVAGLKKTAEEEEPDNVRKLVPNVKILLELWRQGEGFKEIGLPVFLVEDFEKIASVLTEDVYGFDIPWEFVASTIVSTEIQSKENFDWKEAQRKFDKRVENSLQESDIKPTEGAEGKAGMDAAVDLKDSWVSAVDRKGIGAMLQSYREAYRDENGNGLSQTDVGIKMGEVMGTKPIDRVSIARLENGGSASMKYIAAYMEVLGLEPLFGAKEKTAGPAIANEIS